MKLEHFLMSHARGQGKTHNLALLCQKMKASLIVRDKEEASRIHKEYGINSYPFDISSEQLSGHQGIMYVDPEAVGLWILKINHDLSKALEAKAILMEALKDVSLSDKNLYTQDPEEDQQNFHIGFFRACEIEAKKARKALQRIADLEKEK